MIISSQDLRNEYEKFYSRMRNYLWSYDALKALAVVESDIYTSFIDFKQLEVDLSKLYVFMKETAKSDEKLQKSYDALIELCNTGLEPDAKVYSMLNKVQEVNPENDKAIKVENVNNEEETES